MSRDAASRPLLFLDVDGPLNPYVARPGAPEGYVVVDVPEACDASTEPSWPRFRPRPRRVRLNPEHGRALLALDYDLCWATTWMSEANSIIGPAVGLPELPYVDFGEDLFRKREGGIHWKTEPLLRYAAGRPFAWVDDEQSDADRVYVAAHHGVPALLHDVDPGIGLRHQDFLCLKEFAASLARRTHPL
jgi:hypothetical protein